MIPSAINSVYPKFVPNQVLTSDNLNEMFGYLDEQQRITRANLLGIGIVCGLEAKSGTDADGPYIIITRGCGVTSQGYLVTVPEIKYHYYNKFHAVKCKYYERFVNISAKTQKMPLWELKQMGETEDADNPFHVLNDPSGFLNNKVVMIFVELLETNNKNCDPNSCDDKGTMVAVNFRPLLVLKSDADTFLSNGSNTSGSTNALSLTDIRMPRFDVASTLLLDTEDVFQAYQKVLTTTFISTVKSALSDSWSRLNSLFTDDFPSDPFVNLETQFAFLNDGSISQFQALNLQYFYDFFSDLLLGYDELRRKAFDVVCECVPEESLFPRHLRLGEAVGFDDLNSLYRTRFIASPVLCCCADDTASVRSLFKKLVLMIENLSLSEGENEAYRKKDRTVKITPSLLGKEPLSKKAIPFYYRPNTGPDPLYISWNRERTERGTAQQILSARSGEYNTSDDFVKHPLKYDLEPYNFLRVEGHVGQDYRSALADIDSQKQSNRLPVDVIALSSDTRGIFNITGALSTMDTTGSVAAAFEILVKHPACFSDIFLALDEWINKLRCCLHDNKRYFGQLPSFQTRAFMARERAAVLTGAADEVPPDTEFTIEKLYEEKLKAGTINDKFCGDVFVDISTNKAHFGSALVVMPYKIDSMISILPEHISDLDAMALEAKYADLNGSALQLRNLYASKNVAETMTGVDLAQLNSRLEMNCLVCLFLELRLLVKEFLIRLLALMLRQKLGFFAYRNPGIQHKAGVTMGGTFILVYHEAPANRRFDNRKELLTALRKVNTKSGTASGIFSGDQALLSSILLLEEFLFLQKVMAVQEDPNEVLDGIVETIRPGTVIADFYVPYLCCSDCPPAQMIVLPSPEVPNQPPVARAGDSISIQLPVSTVTLDGTNSSDPDGTIQTYRWEQSGGPGTAAFQDPNSAKTDVSGLIAGEYVFKLTVTDNEGATGEDKVTVKVSEKPNIAPVAIATTDKPLVNLGDNPTAQLIGDNSVDPDGTIDVFSWTLKSGLATGMSIQTPDAANSNVKFFQAGVYVFTLTVKDDRGAKASADISIVVQEETIKKTCGPLADIITEFENWNKLIKKNPSFKEVFPPYNDVVKYFRELALIVNKPVDVQIEFFAAGFMGISTPELLMKWLNELQRIILEMKDYRLLALMLYRILNLLAMYIVCIQEEDIDKAKVPMIAVFDLILSHVTRWEALIRQGAFSPEEIDAVKNIAKDIEAELHRVDENGETAAKSLYVEFLRKILDILLSVL